MTTGRRGFTLIEMLIGLVLSGIIGVLLMKLLVTGNRFTDQVEKGREARGVARAPLSLITSEVRMVNAESGVIAAAPDSVTLRVPFMMGVTCATVVGASGTVSAGFLPVDGALAATSLGFNGFAIRQFDGQYSYSPTNTAIPTGTSPSAACTVANVTLPTGSQYGLLTGNVPAAASPGTPIILYRNVRYAFAESVLFPGRRALWRRHISNAGTITSEELASPFDSTARFRFFILNNRVASDTLPTQIADLRGIEVNLPGESERTARERAAPEQTSLVTSIFFLNRLD